MTDGSEVKRKKKQAPAEVKQSIQNKNLSLKNQKIKVYIEDIFNGKIFQYAKNIRQMW